MKNYGAQGNAFILQNNNSYIVFKKREDAVKYRKDNQNKFRYHRIKEALYHHPKNYSVFNFGKLFVEGIDYNN